MTHRAGEKTQAARLATGGLPLPLFTSVFFAQRGAQPCAASTASGSST